MGRLIAEATAPHADRTFMAASIKVTEDDGRFVVLVNPTHFMQPGQQARVSACEQSASHQ